MSIFLFSPGSFVEGIARNIDIFGTLQVRGPSQNPEEADAEALRKDWEAVGGDIRSAINAKSKEIIK